MTSIKKTYKQELNNSKMLAYLAPKLFCVLLIRSFDAIENRLNNKHKAEKKVAANKECKKATSD